MIVAGYIRVSTAEQSRNGLSMESQKHDIETYCREHGHRLLRIYVDAGISARKDLYKRQGFMELMDDVKDGKIQHVVVLRLDRFFRNVYDYHRMMNEYLTPAGVGWSAVKEEYDTTTTNGRLMINLRLSIAEQEADTDSDRIRDVFANRVAQGFMVTGTSPLGYRQVAHRLVIDEETAPIVRDTFAIYDATHSVSRTLAQLRERYTHDQIGQMAQSEVSRLLRKRFYIGEHRGNTEFCPPLVDREVFDRVQDSLTRNRFTRESRNVYVFRGMLRCAVCGSPLFGSPTKYDFKTYRCTGAYHKRICPNRHNTDARRIESFLLENVENLLKDYKVELLAKQAEQKRRVGNRPKIEKKIERLKDLYVDGVIDKAEFARRRAELEAQIVDPEEPKPVDLAPIDALLGSGFQAVYADLSDEEKFRLWRGVIKTIWVEFNEIKGVDFL